MKYNKQSAKVYFIILTHEIHSIFWIDDEGAGEVGFIQNFFLRSVLFGF